MSAASPRDQLLKLLDASAYLVLFYFALRYWRTDAWHIGWLSVSLVAFSLWMLARVQLGASFRVQAEAHDLVTGGLYSKIRNPIYFFGAIAFCGLWLELRLYVWMAFFIVFNLFQFRRIKREEKVLTDAFGERYLGYKRNTWF